MRLTEKQREYVQEMGGHRWGIKTGAVRSGKTYLDIAYTIPKNIIARRDLPGLAVILGNTRGTLQRNVIVPMQEQYGLDYVGDIRADNTARIFGETVFCLGADNIRHVNRIRGASIKYCYGDEITTWDEDVFSMLKSRLDKPYSRFDGACNPEGPQHWLKRFLDSDADIYAQAYQLDDNNFLPPEFVENLKREYAGSVFYDRYVLGLWVAAEGAIYRAFADNPAAHIIQEAPQNIIKATIGIDFGGHGSAHSFTLTGFTPQYRKVVILDEWYLKEEITPQQLEDAFIEFCRKNCQKYPIYEAYADSAETTLIKGLREAARIHAREIDGIEVYKCLKKPINDRIDAEIRLFASNRLKIMDHCRHTIEAFSSAVWDSKSIQDKRLDDGTTNIDSLDSFEYSIEHDIQDMIEFHEWQRYEEGLR